MLVSFPDPLAFWVRRRTCLDRCYVDKSNTCQDATPSKSRPGWVWSCKACDTQKNGKIGNPKNSWRKNSFYRNLQITQPTRASPFTIDRVPEWGRVMLFRKNGLPHSNGFNPETKRDVVMGPTGKMVVTHRATNAPFTKIGLPKQKFWFWGKNLPVRAG